MSMGTGKGMGMGMSMDIGKSELQEGIVGAGMELGPTLS